MATKYVSALDGGQMDSALMDMANHTSEAWAVGTRNGQAVSSGDVTYHNNAKYYSDKVSTDTDRAEAAAARAEAAVPSGTAGAVFFNTAQSLTETQKGQAKANIGAGSTNPNLLDNPWFIKPVNQRGWTSGTANNVYTIDRWKTSSNSSYTVAVNSGYITVTGLFYQKVERKFRTGTPLTISYMLTDGTITQKTGVIGSSEGYAVGNAAFGFYYRPSTGIGDFQIQCTAYDLVACKLELGSVSTLANDAPPDYETELDKCRKYLKVFNPTNGYIYLGGMCQNATQFRSYALPPMAAAGRESGSPTVTLTGSAKIYTFDGTEVAVTGMTSSWLATAESGITLFATVASGLTAYTPATLRIDQGSKVLISCDL